MKFNSVLAAILTLAAVIGARAQETAATNPVPSVEPTFNVVAYHVDGNTVLAAEKLDFLTNYTGPAVTLRRVREGLGELQLLYRNLGFATISVTLPQ